MKSNSPERKVFGTPAEAALFWSIATLAAFWFPVIQLIRKALTHE